MAFCTSCGAQVKGAFCEQCGTPLSAPGGAAAAPPPAMTPPPMTPPAMTPPPPMQAGYAAPPAPAPTKGRIHPIVWVLVGLAGLFVIGVIAVIGAGLFFAHSVAKNPGAVIARLVTAANPNAEVVDQDDRTQTITIRDKKTGERFTLSFDDVKNGRLRMSAVGKHGEVSNVEIGGGTGKMPSWVPTYPGSKAEGNFTARGDDGSGQGAGGMVTFASSDAASKAMDFYTEKINSMGMKIISTTTTGDGGMIIAEGEDGKRSLQVIVGKSGDGTTITLTYGEKK